MPPAAKPLADEALQVRKCQDSDPVALADLRARCHQPLCSILLARGASRTEAEDLLADLWADCVPGPGERPSLLEKFSGKCSLQGWLATVATNRWVDFKRRQARRVELDASRNGSGGDPMAEMPAVPAADRDAATVTMLRESLQVAFALCRPDAMVCLRLVHLHGLSQREVMRLLGWSESKLSRFLKQAMAQIRKATMAELKKRDPWLELTWQDFVEMCENHGVGFL
jgi:RNA polymerase sigma factor (sigma-70 family)